MKNNEENLNHIGSLHFCFRAVLSRYERRCRDLQLLDDSGTSSVTQGVCDDSNDVDDAVDDEERL
jgi:hypothetical protein